MYVRTVPEALAEAPAALVTAGDFRLSGGPVKIAGYEPAYAAPPFLGEQPSGATP